MLFQLLNQVCTRINGMDIATEAPRFAMQLREARPSLAAELNAQGIAGEQVDKTILVLSTTQLAIIKCIPGMVEQMRTMLQNRSAEPAYRCVLAASLAYLVQPQDLLPDNLPGGYGFVDDALLLHESAALSWEVGGDMKQAEEKRKIYQFIFIFVPDGHREVFQNAISGMAMTLNLMRSLDPMVAEMTIQALIANPLQPITPQGGSNAPGSLSRFGSQFTADSSRYGPQYSWRSGNTIGVSFPGGGGVAADGTGVYAF